MEQIDSPKKLINAKITAVAIHSNKTQNYRTKALNKFKKNHIQILVATDVAARGNRYKKYESGSKF
jgi:ATP-dependent RNA helicase RhlE